MSDFFKPTAEQTTAKKPATKKRAAKKPPAKKAAVKKVTVKKMTTKAKTVAKTATVKKIASADKVVTRAKQPAAKKPVTRKKTTTTVVEKKPQVKAVTAMPTEKPARNSKHTKVAVFIDGLNFEHAVRRCLPAHFRRVDLQNLINKFIDHKTERVDKIYLFTASPNWDERKAENHQNYINDLRGRGITVQEGEFRRTTKTLFKHKSEVKTPLAWWQKLLMKIAQPSRLQFWIFEEKETDVNMAIRIVEAAFLRQYQKALIISGDSDIAGAVRMVKANFPRKKFINLAMPHAFNRIMEESCDEVVRVSVRDIKETQLGKS